MIDHEADFAESMSPRNHADTGGARSWFHFALILGACALMYGIGVYLAS